MQTVEPRFPWEIPQPSHVLIASALSQARPLALAAADRVDGLSDAEVAARYSALAAALLALPDSGTGRSLRQLEREPVHQGFPAWETLVMRTGAADDAHTVELARDVWEALGPNEYAVHLRSRPRTYWGFMQGRLWLAVGTLGVVGLVIAAQEARDRWGTPLWIWLPVILAWPAVLWLFLRRYRARERRGGKELPHF